MAMMKGSEQNVFNVEFEDVRFHRATALQPDKDIELTVVIHYGNGSFEVSEGSASIMTGVVCEIDENDTVLTKIPNKNNSNFPILKQDDFYKEMRLRGYHYTGDFKSVTEVRCNGSESRIHWKSKWVPFMYCMLQTLIIEKETRTLMLPTRLQRVRIFPKLHLNQSHELQLKNEDFKVFFNEELNIVQTGGIEFVGLETKAVFRRNIAQNVIRESYKFIQHIPSPVFSQKEALRMCIQLLVENNPTLSNLKVLEIQAWSDQDYIVACLEELFEEVPAVSVKLYLLTDRHVELHNVIIENNTVSSQKNFHLLILSFDSVKPSVGDIFQTNLITDGFIIVRKPKGLPTTDWSLYCLNVVAEIPTETEIIFLLKQQPTISNDRLVIHISNSEEFDWIDKVKESMNTKSVILVSQNEQFSGIIGLVNCILRESDTKRISCFYIDDSTAPPFDLDNPLYSNQILLNLTINVYRQVWILHICNTVFYIYPFLEILGKLSTFKTSSRKGTQTSIQSLLCKHVASGGSFFVDLAARTSEYT